MQVLKNIPIVTTNEFYSEGFSILSENGAKVYHFPMISTSIININVDTKSYTCLIFTSKNGVKYFLKNNKIENKKIITIGNKTAQELKKYGFEADYICSRNYSNKMSNELKTNNVLLDQKSLLVQGNLSDNSLKSSHRGVYTSGDFFFCSIKSNFTFLIHYYFFRNSAI